MQGKFIKWKIGHLIRWNFADFGVTDIIKTLVTWSVELVCKSPSIPALDKSPVLSGIGLPAYPDDPT